MKGNGRAVSPKPPKGERKAQMAGLVERIRTMIFGKNKPAVFESRNRKKARLEMLVTRADGRQEKYVVDEKGQRRVA